MPIRRTLLAAALPMTAAAQTLTVTHKDVNTIGIYAVTGEARAVLPTGVGPHETAISANGRWAVATDYGAQGPGGNTITVIDLAGGAVARTITTPYPRPHGAKFLPDHRTVVITAERDGKVVLIDVTNGEVKGEFATGARLSHMVSLSPDARTAYTANIGDGSLSIIPLDGSLATVVPVGTQTEAINTAPDGRTVWVGSNNTGKVFVIDVARARVIDSVQTNGFPYRIDFTTDGRIAIVTNPEADEIQFIDAATRRIINTLSLDAGAQPFGLAMDPAGGRAWVTLRGAAEVIELTLPEGRITARFPTGPGTGPDGIAYTP